jgi:hypothetical protein
MIAVAPAKPNKAIVDPRKSRITRQLEILAIRSFELADRVADGELELIDAVDVAYEAAICAGLAETAGAEVVQTILAEAFRYARKAVQ